MVTKRFWIGVLGVLLLAVGCSSTMQQSMVDKSLYERLGGKDAITAFLVTPDMPGFEVLRSLRVSKVKTPILILTGLGGKRRRESL